MKLQITCPHCQGLLRVDADKLNKLLRCPACGETFSPNGTTPPAVSRSGPGNSAFVPPAGVKPRSASGRRGAASPGRGDEAAGWLPLEAKSYRLDVSGLGKRIAIVDPDGETVATVVKEKQSGGLYKLKFSRPGAKKPYFTIVKKTSTLYEKEFSFRNAAGQMGSLTANRHVLSQWFRVRMKLGETRVVWQDRVEQESPAPSLAGCLQTLIFGSIGLMLLSVVGPLVVAFSCMFFLTLPVTIPLMMLGLLRLPINRFTHGGERYATLYSKGLLARELVRDSESGNLDVCVLLAVLAMSKERYLYAVEADPIPIRQIETEHNALWGDFPVSGL